MKRLLLIILLSFTYLLGSTQQLSPLSMEEKIIHETINNIYDDFQANAYTCINVVRFSKGKVTKEECEKNIIQKNEECAALIKANIKNIASQEEAMQLMDMVVSCPVIKIMGKEYDIVDGVPIYNMN